MCVCVGGGGGGTDIHCPPIKKGGTHAPLAPPPPHPPPPPASYASVTYITYIHKIHTYYIHKYIHASIQYINNNMVGWSLQHRPCYILCGVRVGWGLQHRPSCVQSCLCGWGGLGFATQTVLRPVWGRG